MARAFGNRFGDGALAMDDLVPAPIHAGPYLGRSHLLPEANPRRIKQQDLR